jgi:hypothetical protein
MYVSRVRFAGGELDGLEVAATSEQAERLPGMSLSGHTGRPPVRPPTAGAPWGPGRPQEGRQRVAGSADRGQIRVQTSLCRADRTATGDLAKDVYGNPGIGHPGQAGVTETVSAQVLVPERRHDLVPMRGISQYGGRDSAVTRSGEQTGPRLPTDILYASSHHVADLDDERDRTRSFALGSLVHEATR